MSKIAEEVQRLSQYNTVISVDYIVENSTIKDIKEYIGYLQKEVKRKDEQIRELVTENVKLEVKLGIN